MFTFTSDQLTKTNWMVSRIEALDASMPISINVSVEHVQNAGGAYDVNTLTFIRGAASVSCNLEATCLNENTLGVALVNLKQGLLSISNPPWEPYPIAVPAAPQPIPSDSYSVVQTVMADGRIEYTQTKPDGSYRVGQSTPVGVSYPAQWSPKGA
jgi:hypothetical protein